MSSIDPADRAEMTILIMREKAAQKDRDKAAEAAALWKQRSQLARQHKEDALAELAITKMREQEQFMAQAEHELACVRDEKDILRRASHWPEDDGSSARAEQLLDDFRALGVRPEDEAFDVLDKQAHADVMLDALKHKLGRDPHQDD